MPLRSRFLAGLLVTLLAASGCDSNNPGSSLAAFNGSYTFSEFEFRTPGTQPVIVDFTELLSSDSRLRIFAGNERAQIEGTFRNGDVLATLRARASRNSVSFDADDNASITVLERLLLPASFTLNADPGVPNELTRSLSLANVNLEQVDSQVYAGLRNVSGTLRIRVNRL